jgi:hypothetical protein
MSTEAVPQGVSGTVSSGGGEAPRSEKDAQAEIPITSAIAAVADRPRLLDVGCTRPPNVAFCGVAAKAASSRFIIFDRA